MSDEIPFRFIRYQNNGHSVFDIVNDEFLSSHECAKRLNNCMRAIGKKDDEIERLKQFQDTVFVLINEMIETANHYRTPIKSVNYGADLGYWNGVYLKLKELRESLEKENGSE